MFSPDTISTITGVATVLGGFGLLISGLGYVYTKFKQGGENALRQSNSDLRDLNEDLTNKIDGLGKRLNEQENKTANLEGQIKILTEQNASMKSLIILALEKYFIENPDIAQGVAKMA